MECLVGTAEVSCGLPIDGDGRIFQRLWTCTGTATDMNASLFHVDDFVNRLIRYPGAIAIRVRIARLRLLGVSVGRKCWIRRVRVPRNPWDIVIEDFVGLDDDVVLL